MKISIIIATFNSEKTIQNCLDSVFNQNYNNYEVLVKDGGSKDNTLLLLDNYRNRFSFYETSNDNGVYDAWNICLNKCTGDWIIFLGSDDYFYYKDFLNDIQPYLKKGYFENYKIVHGKNLIVDSNGKEVSIIGENVSCESKSIYQKMTIRHPGCFHHISLFKIVGKFDSNFKIIGDYQFILRAIKTTKFLFYPFIGVIHTNGGISTNPNYVSRIIKENIKMRRELNIKPYINLNMEMFKRFLIFLIMKMFGKYIGENIIFNISKIKNIFPKNS